MKPTSFPTFNRLMEDFWNPTTLFDGGNALPAVNIKETEKSFDIELAAPGFEKQDFKVDVDNGVLNISAETKKEDEEKNNQYTRREFSYSSFNRSFSLPQQIKEDDIKAKYENGVLKISLEKVTPSTPQKKSISVE